MLYHKHMAQKIVNEIGERYEKIMSSIRCTLSFLIWRSMFIRESRSLQKSEFVDDFAMAYDRSKYL